MEDRHIEERLRNSWRIEPSEEMKERILRKARKELKPRRSVLLLSKLKFAFTTICILIIVCSNVSDAMRQSRLSAMTNGSTVFETAAFNENSWLKMNRDIDWSLAYGVLEDDLSNGLKGDDLL